jgi:membrane protein YqaA with SNARE-associated domain
MNQGTPWNNNAIRGILTFGIGAAYVAAAYMPPEDNQFLAASVLGKGDRTTLLAVAAYSTVCGGLVGCWLDNYSGRIAPAATR